MGHHPSIGNNPPAGSINSDLHDRKVCPGCGKELCMFDCHYSQGVLEDGESDDDVRNRLRFHGMMDALESMILAHACAGIDVTDPDYIEGIEIAVDACGNNT